MTAALWVSWLEREQHLFGIWSSRIRQGQLLAILAALQPLETFGNTVGFEQLFLTKLGIRAPRSARTYSDLTVLGSICDRIEIAG